VPLAFIPGISRYGHSEVGDNKQAEFQLFGTVFNSVLCFSVAFCHRGRVQQLIGRIGRTTGTA